MKLIEHMKTRHTWKTSIDFQIGNWIWHETSCSTHQEPALVLATSTASTMSLAHDVVRPLFLGNLQLDDPDF